jgi:hypothetical protein
MGEFGRVPFGDAVLVFGLEIPGLRAPEFILRWGVERDTTAADRVKGTRPPYQTPPKKVASIMDLRADKKRSVAATGADEMGNQVPLPAGTTVTAFDVTKPAGEPFAVLGALEVVRGSYTFQGRRFEVARGSDVGFRGGPVDNPTLNIRATREISGVTAEVRLRGTARSPEVALTSRPPLDEGEILSLIVFNQPINSLGAAERVNLGERAAAMATGAVTTPLADSIAAALNLDLLEIRPPTSDDGAAAVAIGGRLGSRIFVGVRQEFGRDAGSLLTLEYRVNRVLRFVTSVAQGTLQANATRRADQGGVDLLFVIRY